MDLTMLEMTYNLIVALIFVVLCLSPILVPLLILNKVTKAK